MPTAPTNTTSRSPCTGSAVSAPSRASWCGQLRVGSIALPIKAYPAVVGSHDSQLRQVHAGCGCRIEYHKCCPDHGEVPAEEIIKAFPYTSDRIVELREDELASVRPVDDKTIVLERFFNGEKLDLILLAGRSLYLVPANLAARRSFAVVHAALVKKRKWALGRVVFSGRRQLLVIRPQERNLVAHTLHDPAQQRAPVFALDDGIEVDRAAIRSLGKTIDAAAAKPIPWNDYRDDSEDKLAALVDAKVNPRNKRNGRTTRRLATTGSRKRTSRKTPRAA